MTSERVRAYLSLGSNLGNRLENLAGAVRELGALSGVTVVALSPVYETAPLGADGKVVHDQPAYLNSAVAVDVTVGAPELRAMTAGIERAMGRGEHGRWQSRTIDIDLVLFGDLQVASPTLSVPHPRMYERAFVLRPLVDLDAEISAPGLGRLADLLPSVAWQGCVVHTSAADFAARVPASG